MSTSSASIGASGHTQGIIAQLGRVYELAVLKRGSRDFLSFFDDTKEVVYAYLYHRTGSQESALKLLEEVYMTALGKALSLLWFGSLSLRFALNVADRVVASARVSREADLSRVYLKNFHWPSHEERTSLASLHETLWTLPTFTQRLLTLSLLVGLPDRQLVKVQRLSAAALQSQLKSAVALLCKRWEPKGKLASKLDSLVFVPGLDLTKEDALRAILIDKYGALKYRRYQWLILGGIFAILSNIVVASFLAFAVVTRPATSTEEVRRETRGLQMIAVEREEEVNQVKETLGALYRESQSLTAHQLSLDIMDSAFVTLLQGLKEEQQYETDLSAVMSILEGAKTALLPSVPKEAFALAHAVIRTLTR